jgi:hypothetical protein
MRRWPDLVFCLIWLVTAIIFAVLAYQSKEDESLTLSGYYSTLPAGGIAIGSTDIGSEFNRMSSNMNTNIRKLEESIHHTAQLTFWLNLISCFASFFGLFAQVSSYFRERRRAHHGHRRCQKEPQPEHGFHDTKTV